VHELAIARSILAAAERNAGGLPVVVVRVRIGRLRQVVAESLRFYFELAARDTGCEGAELECERVGSLLRCGSCGEEWDPAPPPAGDASELQISFRCPRCRSSDHSVVSGDELIVDSIDVTETAVTG
jgi:hydrogenase nickel incorporation protein HypA/HybF